MKRGRLGCKCLILFMLDKAGKFWHTVSASSAKRAKQASKARQTAQEKNMQITHEERVTRGKASALAAFETLTAPIIQDYMHQYAIATQDESPYRKRQAVTRMVELKRQFEAATALMGAVEDALDGEQSATIAQALWEKAYHAQMPAAHRA